MSQISLTGLKKEQLEKALKVAEIQAIHWQRKYIAAKEALKIYEEAEKDNPYLMR